jgi:xanthine/uracil permease
VAKAKWFGLPSFTTPHFSARDIAMFAPVVLVLVTENVGHVKAVAAMTGRSMDRLIGKAFVSDGLATTLAGLGGGSGTTTYAENIGVMATTRVYSTAAYWFAGGTAIILGLCPKFGALIQTIPAGVLGGAGVVLYGLIGALGARIWVENRVDFKDPVNLMTAAVSLTIGIANFSVEFNGLSFTGITLGSVAAVLVYHGMRYVITARRWVDGRRNMKSGAPVRRQAQDWQDAEKQPLPHVSSG